MSLGHPLIGIMQGRLSPPNGDKIQSFPRESWKREFFLAREIGFDLIEFVFDLESSASHPLMTMQGLEEIKACVEKTEVHTLSVCADYFMDRPLHKGNTLERHNAFEILEKLIQNCHSLEIKDVVLPCVDHASVSSCEEESLLIEALKAITGLLNKSGVRLALESDYPPHRLKELLQRIESNCVSVNYDSGNSAALGYNPSEEIKAYGGRISSVHIKDRKLQGKTVPLGTGNTNFRKFLASLSNTNYRGAFIIQAARGENEYETCKDQLAFVEELLEPEFFGDGS